MIKNIKFRIGVILISLLLLLQCLANLAFSGLDVYFIFRWVKVAKAGSGLPIILALLTPLIMITLSIFGLVVVWKLWRLKNWAPQAAKSLSIVFMAAIAMIAFGYYVSPSKLIFIRLGYSVLVALAYIIFFNLKKVKEQFVK